MAKLKPAKEKPVPPRQPCKTCGQPMDLTPISLMRYDEADGLKALRGRGFFYACICSTHELQPAQMETWESALKG